MADHEIRALVTIEIPDSDTRRIVLVAVQFPPQRLLDGDIEPFRATHQHPLVTADDHVEPSVVVQIDRRQRQREHVVGKTPFVARIAELELTLVAVQACRPVAEPVGCEDEVGQAVPVDVEYRDRATAAGRFDRRCDAPLSVVVFVDRGRPTADLTVAARVPHDDEVEITVGVEVGERGAARAGRFAGEPVVDREPVRPAEQQSIGRWAVRATELVGVDLAVGEPADEQVGPAVTVHVACRGRVTVHAGERLDEADLVGYAVPGDSVTLSGFGRPAADTVGRAGGVRSLRTPRTLRTVRSIGPRRTIISISISAIG